MNLDMFLFGPFLKGFIVNRYLFITPLQFFGFIWRAAWLYWWLFLDQCFFHRPWLIIGISAPRTGCWVMLRDDLRSCSFLKFFRLLRWGSRLDYIFHTIDIVLKCLTQHKDEYWIGKNLLGEYLCSQQHPVERDLLYFCWRGKGVSGVDIWDSLCGRILNRNGMEYFRRYLSRWCLRRPSIPLG